MDLEKIKLTVRAMLNLAANDAASAGEIANATRFAAKLMEQHQLTEDDLPEIDQKIIDLDKAEMARMRAHTGTSKLASWEGQAAMWACQLVGGVKCHMIHPERVYSAAGVIQLDSDGRPMVRAGLSFYGIAEDVAICKEVFAETITTIAALARLRFGSVYRGDGRCYCEGFVSALQLKVKEDRQRERIAAQEQQRQAQLTGSRSTALALTQGRLEIVTRKEALASKWLKSQGVKLGSARSGGGATHHNGEAYRQGRSDGARHTADTSGRAS